MFRFIKKCFFTAVTFINFKLSTVNSLEYVSMNNQEYKIRTEIINLNTNGPMFYRKIPDRIKDTLVKVFNLMSRTNETRHIKWHKTCKCRRRLDASICNNKQRWNDDKCRCECKELIAKWVCDKGFIWNPSNCECECDKSCDIGEYLGYKNCKCTKK